MFGCMIIHHFFNWKWYQGIFNQQHNAIQLCFVVINVLLLVDIIFLILSGFMMSEYILPIQIMSSLARRIHLVCTHWGFILMSVHMGFHLQMFIHPIQKKLQECSLLKKKMIRLFLYMIAGYGFIVFIKNQWFAYMFLLVEFAYFNYHIGGIQLICECLSIAILFMVLSYHFIKFLIPRNKTLKEKKYE